MQMSRSTQIIRVPRHSQSSAPAQPFAISVPVHTHTLLLLMAPLVDNSSSSAASSAPPLSSSFATAPFPNLLIPFLPVAVLALLSLCILRVALRHCTSARQRRRAQQEQMLQQQQQHPPFYPDVERDVIAPWESLSDPLSPLFLLQHPDMLFPPVLAYPHSPFPHFALLLHSQMPPKYEDALKMAIPGSPLPSCSSPQSLCIPTLATRSQLLQQQQLSPPPCYEDDPLALVARTRDLDMEDEAETTARLTQTTQQRHRRQQEHPPTYSASVDDLSRPVPGDPALFASCSFGLPPVERPCSSCSLGEDPAAKLADRQRRKGLDTFVAKGRARERWRDNAAVEQ